MSVTERTLKRLFALSQNRCAYPNCATRIVQETGTPTGRICHIKARNPGGSRYDAGQTAEERNGFDNLILLCSVHHDIVDDQPEQFTVELLRDMKEIHERNGYLELTPQDVGFVHSLMDSYLRIEVKGDYIAGDKHVYNRPPKVTEVRERRDGAISSSQEKQVKAWIETLVENTVGISRQQAFGMWTQRFKNRFDLAKIEDFLSADMPKAEDWYMQQKGILTRGLKTKAPDAWRNARYGAIKSGMRALGVEKSAYYNELAVRLKMKNPFSSLTQLTKRDLDRVYNMVRRDMDR